MRHHLWLFLLTTALAGIVMLLATPRPAHGNSAPVVSNVVATQIANTGLVRITYDVSDADGDQVTARIIVSLDGGNSFYIVPVSVTGDLYKTMSAGPGKVIMWDAARDFPGRHWSSVVAKIYASDGPSLSGEMVTVAAGSFTMGKTEAAQDYSPAHVVTLDAYQIDKYEVTWAEFQRFVDAGGYSNQSFWSIAGWAWRVGNGYNEPVYSGADVPGFPVSSVSFYEAEAYANFLGKRLPTEAEWEKAARGTDEREWPWGNSYDGSQANFTNSSNPYRYQLAPVGFFDGRQHPNPAFQTTDSPSPFGAYDLAGNVWEWTADWYSSDYYSNSPLANPPGPPTGNYRAIRGGAYVTTASDGRCYSRAFTTQLTYNGYSSPGLRDYSVGFRCVRSLP